MQHICLFKEQTAVDISTTLKTKPRMLNWLFLIVPLMKHWYSLKHEEDLLQQRTTKLLAVGLIVLIASLSLVSSCTNFSNATLFVSCYQPKLFDASTEVSFREAKLVFNYYPSYVLCTRINGNCSRNSLFCFCFVLFCFVFFIKCTQDRKNALLSVLTFLVLCCLGGFIIY